MKEHRELNELLQRFSKIFNTEKGIFEDFNTISLKIASGEMVNAIDYLYNNEHYRHLSMMSYIDRLEENVIELVYILYSYETYTTIILSCDLNRENPSFVTLKNIFPQAETYEIEFNEMMGIDFLGNDRMGEDFILEGWEGPPPMRRDFDTLDYVNDNYIFRSGREDALDVREFIRNVNEEKGGMDD